MQQAGIAGEFLPWRDVLHDGPVPGGLMLKALSEVRADFIVSCGWGKRDDINRSFFERDQTLRQLKSDDRIILWFEHDLYDQLQILQILDWFSRNRSQAPALSMICVDQYLGMMTPENMLAIQKQEKEITDDQFALASLAWSAFTAETPLPWSSLLTQNTSDLPFLRGAVLRMLEEYPSEYNGLPKTALKSLEIIASGIVRPGEIFRKYQQSEERQFMGDSSFWVILNELVAATPGLLKLDKGDRIEFSKIRQQEISITQAGLEVLSGQRNYLDCITIDRWIGGVHLTEDNIWCWHNEHQVIRNVSK